MKKFLRGNYSKIEVVSFIFFYITYVYYSFKPLLIPILCKVLVLKYIFFFCILGLFIPFCYFCATPEFYVEQSFC